MRVVGRARVWAKSAIIAAAASGFPRTDFGSWNSVRSDGMVVCICASEDYGADSGGVGSFSLSVDSVEYSTFSTNERNSLP